MEMARKHSEQQDAPQLDSIDPIELKKQISGPQNQQQYSKSGEEVSPNAAQNVDLDPKAVMESHLDEIREQHADNLNFTIFSKTKFDENLDDAALLTQVSKRFEQSLPLKYVDLVLVQSLEEPVVEEVEAPNDIAS